MRRLDSKQYSCDFMYKIYVDKKRCSRMDIFFINIFDITFLCINIIYKHCSVLMILKLFSHY